MGTMQVVTCDCCNATLPSSGVLDAVIVTSFTDSSVVQHYYGVACGCAGGVKKAVAASQHDDHKAEEPAPAPAAENPSPQPEAAPQPTPAQ